MGFVSLVLREFSHWWLTQLRDVLPAGLRADGVRRSGALLVTLLGDGPAPEAEFRLRRRHVERVLGCAPLDAAGIASMLPPLGEPWPAAVVLRVPAAMMMERVVALPMAAGRDAQRVLGYEMDRLTPFAAQELHWSWRLERKDVRQGKLWLRLTLALRADLRDALAGLAEARLSPYLLEAWPAPAHPRHVVLGKLMSPRQGARLRRAAWGLCGALAVLAAGVPFLQQSLEADGLAAQIDAVRPAVAEVTALRAQGEGQQNQAVARLRAEAAPPLQVLQALTQQMPDDTYLTGLTLQRRQVQIDGRTAQSGGAARLLRALAGSPMVADVGFAAPVTALDGAGGESFSLTLRLAAGAAAMPGRP